MNNDEIIHLTAKQLFCCIIDRDAKHSTDIMQRIIAMGPDASLRFLGEIGNTVDQFRAYLASCAEYGMCNVSAFDCALRRFCNCQKSGDHLIKVGEWD